MRYRPGPRSGLAVTPALAVACLALGGAAAAAADTVTPEAVVATYADLAEATYGDALATAKTLHGAIDALVATPSEASLRQAREAWISARVPYQQSEAFRFGNPLVDAIEGRVNAWPLDEGLIDYVDAAYGGESDDNGFYTANVIANASLAIDGRTIDASTITPELLRGTLHEAGGIESNVATGYHAIEFLLWGQDLNDGGSGAGERPWTDYALGERCSNGHCERRAQYLTAAADLLVDDVGALAALWSADGAARASIVGDDPTNALGRMLTGLGSLSYGELGGERMQLGLMLHDPEEEPDCFSDNTSASHHDDGVGIRNVYEGRYERVDGRVVEGPSLRALLARRDAALAEELGDDIDASVAVLGQMLESQRAGKPYDRLIAEGDAAGNALVQSAIDALIVQTRGIERAVAALGVSAVIEGSESLDDPGSVFQ